MRYTIVRAVANAVFYTALFGGAGAAIHFGWVDSALNATPSVPAEPLKPRPMTDPGDLMEYYGCWEGEAPADMQGQIPGHVVAMLPSGEVEYSSLLVGPALEQIFEGNDSYGLTVYGFCR